MKQIIRNIILCALILSVFPFAAPAQKKGPEQVAIRFTVVDQLGNPVPGAEVSVGEGMGRFMTDADGRVSVNCAVTDVVRVEMDGFKTVNIRAGVLVDSDSVVLVPDVLFAGDTDDIVLPYGTLKKRFSLGSTVTVSGEELSHYSSADIRNALTGVLPGVEVRENYGQVGVSPLEHIGQYSASTAISVSARGRQLMYVVDDVPVQINEVPLNPEQIESVTVIRDGLEKTMYGPTAADGIVFIKTKSGAYNDRYLNVNFEKGVNVTDRMPGYVNAAQYAQLNNLARHNSRTVLLYTAQDVEAYKKGDPYDLLHPAQNFREMMLKNVMNYTQAGVSSGGGNDIVKYYAYLGYVGQDDIYKMGPLSNYNNVSINGNLDVKLNKYIKASFGILSSIGIRKSNNYGYSSNYTSTDASSNTTLGVFELPEILSDINSIPPLAFPIYADNSPELEFPWYAVSSQYTQNPIANILENGSYTETIRSALFNLRLDIDLSFLTKGFKSSTYAAYGATNLVRLGQAEDYAAYLITEGLDIEGNPIIVPVQSSSHSVKEMSGNAKLLDYYSNRLYLVEKLDYARVFGDHDLHLSGDFMITQRSQKFITEHRREMNFGFNARYAYKGRYLVQASLNEHGTYSLLKAWSFSPSLGLGWIISDEAFLKGAKWLDFLKLRVQGSYLSYDSRTSANRDVDNYSWNNSGQKFGPYTTNQWFGSNTSANVNRTYLSMLGNPALGLERRMELSGGVDLTAFGKRLDVSLSGYLVSQQGIITQMQNAVPLTAGISTGSFYQNYDSNLNRGVELNVSWKDKAGDFSYRIGGWLASHWSTIVKADTQDYAEPYRSREGKSATAIWGLKYLGQFTTDEETIVVPQLFDDSLVAGDFRYQDMNGDGYVDSSDICVIGDSAPKLVGALNVNLGWKGLDFTLVGTFRAFYQAQLTNSWFWNGWGDNNYSKYTLNHINDPAAPRLTYNKVNNNYQMSGRWLADGSFFKIQSLEIGYSLPVKAMKIDKVVRGFRFYVRANNLLTLSGIQDVDPEALSSGITNYPLMKTFVGGLKVTF
ncbi:MAG: SusC/RagA family TonB-linked outer membrane protein [Bacteroidales bacterium]|nr:SusC/RagA family TonB-linked outer membrane protein [Bacteroidales bacterium]MBQ7709687.1 SusC/RagA family TonB-linked outer membrane protein [Bacteroidales bacterium]